MSRDKIATYSYDDDRVRFFLRYTFVTAFLAGVITTLIAVAIVK